MAGGGIKGGTIRGATDDFGFKAVQDRTSVHDLHVAINRFVDETNDNPKPFVWTADPNRIIAAVNRGKHVIESIH